MTVGKFGLETYNMLMHRFLCIECIQAVQCLLCMEVFVCMEVLCIEVFVCTFFDVLKPAC